MTRYRGVWLITACRRQTIEEATIGKRLEPERIPTSLHGFEGRWVAMVGDDVIAAAHNPRELAAMLHEMGPRGKKAVARFVPLPSDVIVIGVG
jgi:hypothetical protein